MSYIVILMSFQTIYSINYVGTYIVCTSPQTDSEVFVLFRQKEIQSVLSL
jgi:hypothetical protein